MADGQKLILGVGDYFVIDNFKDYFKAVEEKRIVVSDMVKDVTEAMNAINSGKYSGVLMSSLVLPSGAEWEKYNEVAKKFERFDNSPNIWRSGGLYVVEQAVDKGLITVVNAIVENTEALNEVKRLGAVWFSCFGESKSHDFMAKTLEYFQGYL